MIDVQHLVKHYGPIRAVDDLVFQVPQGQIVGFLGPNGAGKSTTLRILTGFVPPTSGRASIAEFDVVTQSHEARRRIGYLPESTPLYPEMRVEEYLHYRGRLMSMTRAARRQRIEVVCDRCGLAAVRRRIIGQLSRGNRQRVGLAQAMLHDPPVLILDEPTAGLDPNQVLHIRQLIGELRGRHTVLLSTHILSEVERMADRAIIIARGQIRFDQMIQRDRRTVIEARVDPQAMERAIRAIGAVEGVELSHRDGWSRALVAGKAGQDVREPLGHLAARNQWALRELGHESGSLERQFAEVTSGPERDAAAA